MPKMADAVPDREYQGEQALTEINLALDRLMYLLRWLRNNPNSLLPGRLQARFQAALDEFSLSDDTAAPHLTPLDWNANKASKALVAAGLTGKQLALKLEIFNALFDEFLDVAAARVSGGSAIDQTDAFLEAVLPWYRRPKKIAGKLNKALGAGATIVGSVITVAAPHLKERFEGFKELVEAAQHGLGVVSE